MLSTRSLSKSENSMNSSYDALAKGNDGSRKSGNGGRGKHFKSKDHIRDLERFGLFSEVGYLHPAKYVPKDKDLFLFERSKGPQMTTNPPKKGHFDKEAFFTKDFTHIFEKDAYCDYILLRRREKLEASKKNIEGSAFKPSSGPQLPCGRGSLYGTFMKQFPINGEEGGDLGELNIFSNYGLEPLTAESAYSGHHGRNGSDDGFVEHKKNFVTSPPKRGSGYGFPNVTIGKPFKYVPSPFDYGKELELREKQRNKELCISVRPFISAARPQTLFDPLIYNTPENYLPPATGKKGKSGQAGEGEGNAGELNSPNSASTSPKTPRQKSVPALPPFKPSHPPRSGILATFEPYPKAILPSQLGGGAPGNGASGANGQGGKKKKKNGGNGDGSGNGANGRDGEHDDDDDDDFDDDAGNAVEHRRSKKGGASKADDGDHHAAGEHGHGHANGHGLKSIFRPTGGSHSFPIRSIALMNVPKIPSWALERGLRLQKAQFVKKSSSTLLSTSRDTLAFNLPVDPSSGGGRRIESSS